MTVFSTKFTRNPNMIANDLCHIKISRWFNIKNKLLFLALFDSLVYLCHNSVKTCLNFTVNYHYWHFKSIFLVPIFFFLHRYSSWFFQIFFWDIVFWIFRLYKLKYLLAPCKTRFKKQLTEASNLIMNKMLYVLKK